jgi:hypothetical protein
VHDQRILFFALDELNFLPKKAKSSEPEVGQKLELRQRTWLNGSPVTACGPELRSGVAQAK